jgi:tetratricopeptide (TPR) repeat protein
MREKEEPIAGYTRALKLAEGRIDPSRPLELFGRLSRRVMERLFARKERVTAAEKALLEQQGIIAELERLGAIPPEPSPSESWDAFARSLAKLLEQERSLIESAGSWNSDAAAKYGTELRSMLLAVEKGLEDVPRLVETSAELHDRLGLALLEAERFGPAREHFDAAFRLNKGLGHTENLVQNRRSASIALYRQAQTLPVGERSAELHSARDGFRELLSLITLYPPKPKEAARRSGGIIDIGASVSLDKGTATQAAFGFTADQERRLAEVYLARILSELGEPAEAVSLLRQQLGRYPVDNESISGKDLYGVGLLTHRIAHVDYSLGDRTAAASEFRRSTLLSLQSGNPVSAMLNLINWGALLSTGPDPADISGFLGLAARTSQLAGINRDILPPLVRTRYHNDPGAIIACLAVVPVAGGMGAGIVRVGERPRTC